MKLELLSEADFTKAAQKLNAQVVKTGVADLQGLVRDPHHTVALIRRGMTAKGFIFADMGWVEDFLRQWYLLDEDTLEEIFDRHNEDFRRRVQQMRTEGVMSVDYLLSERMQTQFNPPISPVLSGAGRFLAKLAKFALILIKLLATARGAKGLNKEAIAELGVFNPYVVYRLTSDLQATSQKALKARKQQQNKQNLAKARQAQGKRQLNVP